MIRFLILHYIVQVQYSGAIVACMIRSYTYIYIYVWIYVKVDRAGWCFYGSLARSGLGVLENVGACCGPSAPGFTMDCLPKNSANHDL